MLREKRKIWCVLRYNKTIAHNILPFFLSSYYIFLLCPEIHVFFKLWSCLRLTMKFCQMKKYETFGWTQVDLMWREKGHNTSFDYCHWSYLFYSFIFSREEQEFIENITLILLQARWVFGPYLMINSIITFFGNFSFAARGQIKLSKVKNTRKELFFVTDCLSNFAFFGYIPRCYNRRNEKRK